MAEEVYQRLTNHLSTLCMGYPPADELGKILKEHFTPVEAEVVLALPTRVAPLDTVSVEEIGSRIELPREELKIILEGLVQRGLLFSGKTETGEKGYALLQVGYGFPQTFFWGGKDTPEARNMVGLLADYFKRERLRQAYGGSETKVFRFIPVGETIDQEMQAVFPYDLMKGVVEKAGKIAVAHCPCRMMYQLRGKSCEHPLEVCLKYDEVAEYVIERGLAREVSREEALDIIKKSEEAGLVHLVDNAMGEIKHT